MGLFDIFSSKAADKAAAAKEAGYRAGLQRVDDSVNAGKREARVEYDKAAQPFETLFEGGLKGYDAYSDATGVNGAEGIARAKSNFTSLPGYTEGIDMALDQNDRRAAARGMLGSGNTIADTTQLATNYANQKYGDYVTRLAPHLSVASGGASGIGQVYTGLGSLVNQDELARAGYGYAGEVGIGNAKADAEMDRLRASGQMWNGLFKGLDIGGKLLGMGGF